MPDPSIFLIHNHYQQAGGEDAVVRAESELLRARGHQLHEYRVHNNSVDGMGKLGLLKATMWNRAAHRDIVDGLGTAGAQVAHFHNAFPLVSPAGYYAARRRHVAVVQTLHNYRLLCPSAILFRDGHLCEQCLGKTVPWPGVLHACYRGSHGATAAVAAMLTLHRAMGTWTRMVDVYIALTEFARRKFISGGLPAEQIVVKPNFTADPGIGRHDGGSVLFVGRLTAEKGIATLIEAWRIVSGHRPEARLQIVGDGPLSQLQASEQAGVEWLGRLPQQEVRQAMQRAAFLVFPSEWYEGFPMTIVEAFAAGLPVVASRLGSAAELIRDGETGRLYSPANPADLAAAIEQLLADGAMQREMGRQARLEYEAKYTPARNYQHLMQVYELAIERARSIAAQS